MPQLIWEDVKLFAINNDKFTVVASGLETRTEKYASVMIFDTQNRDCMSMSYPLREKLIELLSNRLNDLSPNMAFYKVYR